MMIYIEMLHVKAAFAVHHRFAKHENEPKMVLSLEDVSDLRQCQSLIEGVQNFSIHRLML